MMSLRVSGVLVFLALTFSSCSSAVEIPPKPRDAELEKWIGQMLLVGFRGMDLDEIPEFRDQMKALQVGGVVLFDYDVIRKEPNRNIQSAEQVRRLVEQLQSVSEIPLFVAIDQEGGRIARLKPARGFPETRSQAALGMADEESLTRENARTIGETLKSLGINVNFAPVLDLNVNPDNPIIAAHERSYGSDPELVIRHARWTIDEFHKSGILSAIKHFPGHGSSREDSHIGLPDVTQYWDETELTPFRGIIGEGLADMVMTAHLFNEKWDTEKPATLSESVLTGLLRNEIGFSGVIISDDLNMAAIREEFSFEDGVREAILAGADILTFGNNLNYDPEVALKAFVTVYRLVERGEVSRERIRESYDRIMDLKGRLNSPN